MNFALQLSQIGRRLPRRRSADAPVYRHGFAKADKGCISVTGSGHALGDAFKRTPFVYGTVYLTCESQSLLILGQRFLRSREP
nr:hypothetical protein [Herbidospora mongoliensis]